MDPRLPLAEVPGYARRIESMGFDGLHVSETVHDSLTVSALAAEHTERIVIRTAVTLAFARSPTLTAYTAWQLSRLSGGRFQLGLGTQIRQNIEDRFGMPWTEPVARLREYVEALAALYEAFRTGGRLCFEGSAYRLTRMQPYFNPGPDEETVVPPTWLGGVGPGMCELAGELADGLLTHPTNSDPRYLREVVRPGLAAGAAHTDRSVAAVGLVVSANLAAGVTDDEVATERERQRRLLAFLYSTPAYRRTLELYGFGDLPDRLRAMIRAEDWDALPSLVSDDLLDALVAVGRYDELADVLRGRFGGLADGIVLSPQATPAHDSYVAALVAAVQNV